MKKKMKLLLLCLLFLLLIFLLAGLYSPLETTNYTYSSSKVPESFDGYKIVVLSDFHCKEFGQKEQKLLQQIDDANPDIVVLLGDVIDGDHQDLTPASDLLSGLSEKYPIYAIRGNHEFDSDAPLDELEACYDTYDVTRLYGESATLTKESDSIVLYGINYAEYYADDYWTNQDTNPFSILLFHDASHFENTCRWGYDMVLGGHVHGGIVRLPFIGGLFNNTGTLFCKYEKGEYHLNNVTEFSSAGLGDAAIPRFYNHPEILTVTLKHSN